MGQTRMNDTRSLYRCCESEWHKIRVGIPFCEHWGECKKCKRKVWPYRMDVVKLHTVESVLSLIHRPNSVRVIPRIKPRWIEKGEVVE